MSYQIPFDNCFELAKAPTAPPKAMDKKACKVRLEALKAELDKLQQVLYADKRYAVLAIFQAMDAGGKDSTIRAVFTGVDPAGCRVHAFQPPSSEERAHDFLWRTVRRLPERGHIGVFNRSYYEEVLIARVHPELLKAQSLPNPEPTPQLWRERFESIREHEKHLARNGTVVIKFWLNLSYDEQRRRFLARIDKPKKSWKFASGDVEERKRWQDYLAAYQEALNETSREWAPWYAIPADDKPFLRVQVAEVVVETLKRLDLKYPKVSEDRIKEIQAMRQGLEND